MIGIVVAVIFYLCGGKTTRDISTAALRTDRRMDGYYRAYDLAVILSGIGVCIGDMLLFVSPYSGARTAGIYMLWSFKRNILVRTVNILSMLTGFAFGRRRSSAG